MRYDARSLKPFVKLGQGDNCRHVLEQELFESLYQVVNSNNNRKRKKQHL